MAVVLSSLPALGATEMSATLTASVVGTSVTYTLKVCHQGKESPVTTAGLYYHRTSAPSCSTTPDHTWSVPALKTGACETLTHVRNSVAVGDYEAWAMADQGCIVVEIDETDNLSSVSYSVMPDLSISAFSTTVTGSDVDYSVTVKNIGTGVPSSFTVGVYYNRSTSPTCASTPDATLTIAGLAAGASVTTVHQRGSVAVGSYKAYALVDQGCTVTEKSETNNVAYSSYYLGPNIRVYTPVVTVNGAEVTYSVQVCNQNSSQSLGSFPVALWYDLASAPACGATGADHTWSVPSLTVGQCAQLSHKQQSAAAGSRKAQVFGDPACALAEATESDNIRSRDYTVGSPVAPDLYFSSFSASLAGSTVTFEATVCNAGTAVSGAIEVGLFHDGSAAPTCASTPDHTWTVSGLGSGVCKVVSQVHAAANGSYQGWVLADAKCAITESSETNNTRSATYAVGQPDLYAKTFSAAVNGSDVAFNAQICNGGSEASGSFSVAIFQDRATEPACGEPPDHSKTLSGLAAGACTTVNVVQSGASTGAKKAWVLTDNLCQIVEGSETNNARYYQYGVGVDQPDLRVAQFEVAAAGALVTFDIIVCNAGAASAPPFELGVFYDSTAKPVCGDAPSWTVAIPGLASGDCESHTHRLESAKTGSYTGWATVDVGCVVGETDETNNSESRTYQAVGGQPDLAVTALAAQGSGDRAVVTVTICNVGGEQSAATISGLYLDPTAAPDTGCTATPTRSIPLGPLDVGLCVNQVWVTRGAAGGSHTVWALADSTCAVGEVDELNNISSHEFTLAPGADGGPGTDGGGDGCSCRLGGRSAPAALPLLLLALALVRRRRR